MGLPIYKAFGQSDQSQPKKSLSASSRVTHLEYLVETTLPPPTKTARLLRHTVHTSIMVEPRFIISFGWCLCRGIYIRSPSKSNQKLQFAHLAVFIFFVRAQSLTLKIRFPHFGQRKFPCLVRSQPQS